MALNLPRTLMMIDYIVVSVLLIIYTSTDGRFDGTICKLDPYRQNLHTTEEFIYSIDLGIQREIPGIPLCPSWYYTLDFGADTDPTLETCRYLRYR